MIRGAKSVVVRQRILDSNNNTRETKCVGKKFGSRNSARLGYNDLYVKTVRKNEVDSQLFF
jgi:hypothetical protein